MIGFATFLMGVRRRLKKTHKKVGQKNTDKHSNLDTESVQWGNSLKIGHMIFYISVGPFEFEFYCYQYGLNICGYHSKLEKF